MKIEIFVAIAILLGIFYLSISRINKTNRPTVVYNVKPYVQRNNVLYGKASRRPIPYPHLVGDGPKVPSGSPEWLI
jgi:hypothetical protein